MPQDECGPRVRGAPVKGGHLPRTREPDASAEGPEAEGRPRENPGEAATPDAALFFADRLLALDHAQGDVYALALCTADDAGQTEAASWLEWAAGRVEQLLAAAAAAPVPPPPAGGGQRVGLGGGQKGGLGGEEAGGFRLRRPAEGYLEDIGACLECIRAGDTYEVCLTNAFERPAAPPARALYSALRSMNPAPYAAWLCFGRGGEAGGRGGGPDELTVCSSSPERFLRLDREGVLEAKARRKDLIRRFPFAARAFHIAPPLLPADTSHLFFHASPHLSPSKGRSRGMRTRRGTRRRPLSCARA